MIHYSYYHATKKKRGESGSMTQVTKDGVGIVLCQLAIGPLSG